MTTTTTTTTATRPSAAFAARGSVAIAFAVAFVAALLASATEAFVPTRGGPTSNRCGGTTSIGSVSTRSPISGGPRRSSELRNARAKADDDDDDRGDAEAAAKPAPGTELVTNDNDNDSDSDGGLPNLPLLKDTEDLVVGDWVVAKKDVPSQGIRSGAVYKLLSVYLKGAGANEPGLGVEIVPLDRLGDAATGGGARFSGYTTYLRVWNPRDHGDGNGIGDSESESESDDPDATTAKGVVVTPDEIGLVSLKADWTEAALLAVPGFVWVAVAASFSNYYTNRYGGSFWDAFFRT